MMLAEHVFRLFLEDSGRGEDWDPWKMTGPGEERLRTARRAVLEAAGTPELGTTLDECIERPAVGLPEDAARRAAGDVDEMSGV